MSTDDTLDSALVAAEKHYVRKRGTVEASVAIGGGQARWNELGESEDAWGFQWGLSLGGFLSRKFSLGVDIRSLIAGGQKETDSNFIGLVLTYYPWSTGTYVRLSAGGTSVTRKSVELAVLETVDVDESGGGGAIALGYEWNVSSIATTALELSAEYANVDGDVFHDFYVIGLMLRTTYFGRWGH